MYAKVITIPQADFSIGSRCRFVALLGGIITVYLLISPGLANAQSCKGPLSGLWVVRTVGHSAFTCQLTECSFSGCVCKTTTETNAIIPGSAIAHPIVSGICHEGNTLSGEESHPDSGFVSTFSGIIRSSGRPGILDDIVEFTQSTQVTVSLLTQTTTISGKGIVVEPGLLGAPWGIEGDWQRLDEALNSAQRCFSGPFQRCTSEGRFETLITGDPKNEFRINFTTFIPGPRMAALDTCKRVQFNPPEIAVLPLYVRLDDRGFDPHATTYRTRQRVTVIPDEAVDPNGLKEGTKEEALANPTKVYAEDALPIIDDNDDDYPRLRDCHLLHKQLRPIKKMRIRVKRTGPKSVEVNLFGHARTRFPDTFPRNIVNRCAISWNIFVHIDTSGPRPVVTLSGAHDGFPAYELYVNDERVHEHRVAAPDSPFDLAALCHPLDVPVTGTIVLPEQLLVNEQVAASRD